MWTEVSLDRCSRLFLTRKTLIPSLTHGGELEPTEILKVKTDFDVGNTSNANRFAVIEQNGYLIPRAGFSFR